MTAKDNGMNDISQVISELFSRMTKSEKRIANFIRKNQEEAAFLAAGDLADRLGLSEATIVRFARTLGYSSYPAMRDVLQDNFRQRVTHSARLRSRLDALREGGDLFEKVTISEIDYLTQALLTVDRDALSRAAAYLLACERVFVFGTGASKTLVDLLELRLTRFGKHVIPITTTGRESLEPLILMTGRDLLFTIAFFDLNPMVELILDRARTTGCPVVLLTDTLGSMIGGKADTILAARRGPVSAFHSLVVPMTIINTLLLEIANRNQFEVTTNLDHLDQLRETLKHSGGA